MAKLGTGCAGESSPSGETLEAWVRERIQGFLQALLEEEVTSVLGRRRSERRRAIDARPGYRTGYGKPRRLSLTSGAITVRRPRLRNLEERFASAIRPCCKRRTRAVGALLPQLYLHGLAAGDCELALRRLLGDGAPFGPDRELSDITVADVTRWAEALLATRPTGRRAETMSGGTVRHYLTALSNLYRRAQAEGYVVPGYNPVSAMLEKPAARRGEALWLEVPDASLLLEAARLHDPTFAYPLIATFLLSGGRESEVLGLEVPDVSTDRRIVTFRPNRWRRLKTAASCRTVPLWPQLREILGAYLVQRPPAQLLFPSYRTGEEAMLTDWRKLLDKVASRAGWEPGQIRSKMFRHTYCAARLQTLDHGAPVSVCTVAREMGHGGEAMVRRVYGHLGAVRHRSEVVEYRVQQHRKVLGNRLKTLLKQAHTPRPGGVGARS